MREVDAEEDEEEGNEFLPACAIRALSSYTEGEETREGFNKEEVNRFIS